MFDINIEVGNKYEFWGMGITWRIALLRLSYPIILSWKYLLNDF